jgi:hypothetical protein
MSRSSPNMLALTTEDWLMITALALVSLAWWVGFRMIRARRKKPTRPAVDETRGDAGGTS